MSLLVCVIHISVIHITFRSQIDLQLKTLVAPLEVIVNPYFSGNLWRCLIFVKCSLSQTKCQTTWYHVSKPKCDGLCISLRGKLVLVSGYYQKPGALSATVIRHGLHHNAS